MFGQVLAMKLNVCIEIVTVDQSFKTIASLQPAVSPKR